MKVIESKKALVMGAKHAPRIKAVIPHAELVQLRGRELLAIRHGIDETRVLRNLGFAAPSPILHYYDWPRAAHIANPFEAQLVTAAMLTLNQRAYCLNGLGSGKTQATLWAYDYLRSRGKVGKMLVVAPLSTLELTWAQAIFEHFPHLECQVVHAARARRLEQIKADVDVYITNHDGAKIIADALKDRYDITLVVVDELAQCARNARTDRWRALNTIINKHAVKRMCWGLTATPTPNEPTDAWSQCRLITPETVPKTFTRFRDMVMQQIGPYLWRPRKGATDTVYDAMQPAIRFSREECVDLPPTTFSDLDVPLTGEQAKAYKAMEESLKAQLADGDITAVNEAVKANKLVQICCLAGDTRVLTRVGWKQIRDVTASDQVWDGVEWVATQGAAYMGNREVTGLDGVRLTPDHRVLTHSGWQAAGDILEGIHGDASERFDRAAVRLPCSAPPAWVNTRENQMRYLDVPLRLRKFGSPCESGASEGKSSKRSELWLRPRGVEQDTWRGQPSTLQYMGAYESEMLGSYGQRLASVRRSRDNCLLRVDGIIRSISTRHGAYLQRRTDSREARQQRPLLEKELPMGDLIPAGQESTQQQMDHHTRRGGYCGGGSGYVRHEANHSVRATESRLVRGESTHHTSKEPVYDLIECGPRNRFVVQGEGHHPIIVHNCGVVYSSDHEELKIPNKPRVQETLDLIRESHGKVIVFVPFISALTNVAESIRQAGYRVGIIHGGVSKNDRDTVFASFQRLGTLDVIVAQPAAMSHGLTLTAASTIIWFAPITSADIFEQANGRITRPGQKHNTLVAMISGTPVERKMYQRLKNKQKMQGLLLDRVVAGREA